MLHDVKQIQMKYHTQTSLSNAVPDYVWPDKMNH